MPKYTDFWDKKQNEANSPHKFIVLSTPNPDRNEQQP